jgi:hypothetical protein
VPELSTRWQDAISAERIGWRQRAANLQASLHSPSTTGQVACRRHQLIRPASLWSLPCRIEAAANLEGTGVVPYFEPAD